MLAFPPLLALATTNPMCLFKIPMKLKVDPSKMPKLAGKQKKLEQKWGTHKDKAMKRKEQLEGKLSDAEAAGEWGSVISGEDISVSGLEGEEAEAVGEATSLSLAFMGATTPKGVIVFLWEMFKLVADKAGIAELQTFAESEDMNLIFFLMMLFWDGICGQFATAIMSIVTQLIFCNCGFCDNSCEVSQFDFRNKPENLELTAPPPTLEDTKNNANKPATTTMAKRFLFHPTADTCSVTRTVQNHEEFGFWWQEVRFFFYYFIICLNCHFLVTTEIILLTSLLMFSCLGLPMESSSVMVVLQLLLILQLTMAKFLCMAIMGFSQAWISMERIGTFLLSQEVVVQQQGQNVDSNVAIQYQNASASWSSGNPQKVNEPTAAKKSAADTTASAATVLSKINVTVQRGDLVVVVGAVGSGKTSLLMSLLSELPLSSGAMYIHPELQSSTSYVGQTPYIQSGTIKDNIIFGLPMDTDRFNKVITACALDSDIRALSNGELTLVGEKGVTLSGGQRARVALARAAYAQANLVLLDDPLSAVDPSVSASLVDNVITADVEEGGLRRRQNGLTVMEKTKGTSDSNNSNDSSTTVILCTHQVQFANRADIVVVFNPDGSVVSGSYTELQNHPALFREENEKTEEQKQEHDDQEQVQQGSTATNIRLAVQGEGEETMAEMMDKLRSLSTTSSTTRDERALSTNSSNHGGKGGGEGEEGTSRQTSTRSNMSRSISHSFDGIDGVDGIDLTDAEKTSCTVQEAHDRKEIAETRQTGIVQWSTYAGYLQAGGGWCMFLPLTVCMMVGQGMVMFTAWTMTGKLRPSK